MKSENGIPSNIHTIETLDDPDAVDSYDTDPIASQDKVYNCETDTNSFIPQLKNDHVESDAIKSCLNVPKIDWPTIENKPLNEYTTPFLATLAFPALFADDNADSTSPCLQRDVPSAGRIQHQIKYS